MNSNRILVRCIPNFEMHQNDPDVIWHVQHEKQNEMSRKSVVVSYIR